MLIFHVGLVLACLLVGGRLGGLALGAVPALGVLILVLGFGFTPGDPPIKVLLIIASVVCATSMLEAAGGLQLCVKWAERILRRHPQYLTFLAPLVVFLFTMGTGTGHVAYALFPVIQDIAVATGLPPERPLSVSVIASEHGVTASPVSAATAALLTMLAPRYPELSLGKILSVTVPASLLGIMLAAASVSRRGQRITPKDSAAQPLLAKTTTLDLSKSDQRALLLFLLGVVFVVVCGLFPGLRSGGKNHAPMAMEAMIQLSMLGVAATIALVGPGVAKRANETSVFRAGMTALVAVLGVSWLGSTVLLTHQEAMLGGMRSLLQLYPWLLALGLFVGSVILFSQAATLTAMVPIALIMGVPAGKLIALAPAVNGLFFLPFYGTTVAAAAVDTTGSTRLGRYLIDHSFMRPGLVAVIVAVLSGWFCPWN